MDEVILKIDNNTFNILNAFAFEKNIDLQKYLFLPNNYKNKTLKSTPIKTLKTTKIAKKNKHLLNDFNKKTLRAIEECENHIKNKTGKTYKSVDEMWKDLGIKVK